jgi:hypothetical protein
METAWNLAFDGPGAGLWPPLDGVGRTDLALRRDRATTIPTPASKPKKTKVMSIASMFLIFQDFGRSIVDRGLK